MLTIKFWKEDLGNNRFYYKGISFTDKGVTLSRKNCIYCRTCCNDKNIFDGEWFKCSKDGEPSIPLKKNIEITIVG